MDDKPESPKDVEADADENAVRPEFFIGVTLAVILIVFTIYLSWPKFEHPSGRHHEGPPREQAGRKRPQPDPTAATPKPKAPKLVEEDGIVKRILDPAPLGSIRAHPLVLNRYLVYTSSPKEEIEKLLDRDRLRKSLEPVVARERMTVWHELLLSHVIDPRKTTIECKDAAEFDPITEAQIRAYGKSLNREEADALLGARWVIEIETVARNAPAPDRLQELMQMARQPRFGLIGAHILATLLCRDLNGIAVDRMSGHILPFREMRRRSVRPIRPAVAEQYFLQIQRDEWTYSLQTQGLLKFGVPELLLRDVPPMHVTRARKLMEGVAHQLVRQLTYSSKMTARLHCPREIHVTSEDIEQANGIRRAPTVRPAGKSGSCWVRLEDHEKMKDTPRELRHLAQTLRIVAPRDERELGRYWLFHALDGLLGLPAYKTETVKDPHRLERARRQALKALPDARRRFLRGLASGELLLVRHGFPNAVGRREFMMVQVTGWSGGTISGRLASVPQERKDLKLGQKVTLAEPEIHDWVILRGDGTVVAGDFWTRKP